MFRNPGDIGFQASLNDSRTKNSGLSCLRDQSFDKVKIDSFFVRQIDHCAKAPTNLPAIVLICAGP
jgi:EAL domain-containing protein (putative c-di-GMP-specific phosphodiesterase class I)